MSQRVVNEVEASLKRGVHGLGQGLQIEAHAEAGRRRQQRRRVGVDALEALRHQGADIVADRMRLRALSIDRPAALLDIPGECPLEMQGDQQLTDEEWVT